jgi:hypothetical protein
MNALSTIAEAVRASLQPLNLGQTFTVERYFQPPDYNTAATTELKICVVGFGETPNLDDEGNTRAKTWHTYTVKVAIVKRLDAADVTKPAAIDELDALSDVRESVLEYLEKNPVMGDARLVTLSNAPAAFDPATLNEKKTFASVISGDYRLQR